MATARSGGGAVAAGNKAPKAETHMKSLSMQPFAVGLPEVFRLCGVEFGSAEILGVAQ